MNSLLKKKIGKETRRNGYTFDDMMNAVQAMQHQKKDQFTEAALYRDKVSSGDLELWQIAGDIIQFSKDVGAIS